MAKHKGNLRVVAMRSQCLSRTGNKFGKRAADGMSAWVISGHFALQSPCPLWVISGHVQRKTPCPLYPQQRPQKRTPAKGHVRFTPESGHVRCTSSGLLWANSGHWLSITRSLGRPGGERSVGQQY